MNSNIDLPDDLYDEASLVALRKGISYQELVRQAVQHYVNGDHVDVIEISSEGKILPVEAEKKLLDLRGVRS